MVSMSRSEEFSIPGLLARSWKTSDVPPRTRNKGFSLFVPPRRIGDRYELVGILGEGDLELCIWPVFSREPPAAI